MCLDISFSASRKLGVILNDVYDRLHTNSAQDSILREGKKMMIGINKVVQQSNRDGHIDKIEMLIIFP